MKRKAESLNKVPPCSLGLRIQLLSYTLFSNASTRSDGSSVPIRNLRPDRSCTWIASRPETLYSQPCGVSRIPQPKIHELRTCLTDSISCNWYVFFQKPGPKKCRSSSPSTSTVREPNSQASTNKTKLVPYNENATNESHPFINAIKKQRTTVQAMMTLMSLPFCVCL